MSGRQVQVLPRDSSCLCMYYTVTVSWCCCCCFCEWDARLINLLVHPRLDRLSLVVLYNVAAHSSGLSHRRLTYLLTTSHLRCISPVSHLTRLYTARLSWRLFQLVTMQQVRWSSSNKPIALNPVQSSTVQIFNEFLSIQTWPGNS